ncbi:MAG: hypothetical protein ACPH2K_03225, partial [Flavicella sp.]
MKYFGTIKGLINAVVFFIVFTTQAQQVFTVSNEGGKGEYKSIYKALDAIAVKVAKLGYPEEGIELVIKDGYYKIDRKILLPKALSGSSTNPLVIRA